MQCRAIPEAGLLGITAVDYEVLRMYVVRYAPPRQEPLIGLSEAVYGHRHCLEIGGAKPTPADGLSERAPKH